MLVVIVITITITIAIALGTALGVAPAEAAPLAPFEPVSNTVVPLPPAMRMAIAPAFTPDGGHLLFTGIGADGAVEIYRVSLDGGGLTCLTCDLPGHPSFDYNTSGSPTNIGYFLKPYPFSDGKRAMLMFENGPGVTDTSAYVLECAPSILDCAQRALLPIDQSSDGGAPTGNITRREIRVAPDGTHLAWTIGRPDGLVMIVAKLERTASGYTTSDARVINPAAPSGLFDADPMHWVNGGDLYELKGFVDNGRSVMYVGFTNAGNPDNYIVDLATGHVRRLTAHPDWDEDGGTSPDGRNVVIWSDRNLHRVDTLGLFPRPPFVDLTMVVHAAGYFLSAAGFHCTLQPWLLPPDGDRGGTIQGQPVDPRDSTNTGWFTGINVSTDLQWSPDSTKLALFEQRNDFSFGNPPSTASRLVITRLTARHPQPVPAPASSEVGDWAGPPSSWMGDVSTNRTLTLQGPGGGTVDLSYAGNLVAGRYSATYHHYSDDGRSFLDGTDVVTNRATSLPDQEDADLTLNGAHTGSLHAHYALGSTYSGTVEASLDGRHLSGLPASGPCPELLPRVQPLRALVRRRARSLIVHVTANEYGDVRPVTHARVRFAQATALTDDAGDARFAIRPARTRHTAGVRAAGFLPGSVTVAGWTVAGRRPLRRAHRTRTRGARS